MAPTHFRTISASSDGLRSKATKVMPTDNKHGSWRVVTTFADTVQSDRVNQSRCGVGTLMRPATHLTFRGEANQIAVTDMRLSTVHSTKTGR